MLVIWIQDSAHSGLKIDLLIIICKYTVAVFITAEPSLQPPKSLLPYTTGILHIPIPALSAKARK